MLSQPVLIHGEGNHQRFAPLRTVSLARVCTGCTRSWGLLFLTVFPLMCNQEKKTKPQTKAELQAEIDYWRGRANMYQQAFDISQRGEKRATEYAEKVFARQQAQERAFAKQIEAARLLIELTACRTGN